ncbi:aurora kinase-like [Xenia sp. Carnegie-2017]|uniref:aurora kinase-like n=1 Tax=Xenia sp. Carnegie-2017 TaxID=2897299 RepID=UPI001F03A323|nr:aurora kinase-like [Xenia sp. Carnegie-2017]
MADFISNHTSQRHAVLEWPLIKCGEETFHPLYFMSVEGTKSISTPWSVSHFRKDEAHLFVDKEITLTNEGELLIFLETNSKNLTAKQESFNRGVKKVVRLMIRKLNTKAILESHVNSFFKKWYSPTIYIKFPRQQNAQNAFIAVTQDERIVIAFIDGELRNVYLCGCYKNGEVFLKPRWMRGYYYPIIDDVKCLSISDDDTITTITYQNERFPKFYRLLIYNMKGNFLKDWIFNPIHEEITEYDQIMYTPISKCITGYYFKDDASKLAIETFSAVTEKHQSTVVLMNMGYDADMFNGSVRLVYHDNGGVALVTNERKVQLEPKHHPWGILSDKSSMHYEKLKKMEEHRKKHSTKVKYINDVFVIFSEEFLLGKGSDGTRVYLGLGKDGYGKAVKRLYRDSFTEQAKQEKDVLNDFNAKSSKYVVNYCYLEEEPGDEFVYLVLDLCEESLESFVKSSTLDELQIELPKVLRHILKGLADLHSGPRPILHRDLRPSNVLRDVQGNFLIADFGISRRLLNETLTYESIQRGAKNWIAPESYDEVNASINSARYKKQSDVMNAGMVAYYVATKGEHPFGHERHLLDNLLNGKPVGLDKIKDSTLKDLLSWMLKRQPEDRPLANEALKHPYFSSDYE